MTDRTDAPPVPENHASSARVGQASPGKRAPPPPSAIADPSSPTNATATATGTKTQPREASIDDLDALDTKGGGKSPPSSKSTGTGSSSQKPGMLKSLLIRVGLVSAAPRPNAPPQPKFSGKHFKERMCVLFIGIAMLWLTSLALCQAIVNAFIRGPNPTQVMDEGDKSMQWAEDQRLAYLACAERLLQQWNNTMARTFQTEVAATRAAQAYNAAVIQEDYAYRNSCSVSVQRGSNTLRYLQTNNNVTDPIATFPTPISYTDPRCNLVTQMAAGSTGAIQALGTSEAYSQDASSQTGQLSTQINARASYDSQYAAQKNAQLQQMGANTLAPLVNGSISAFQQVNDTMNAFLACQSPTGVYGGQTCPGASTLAQIQEGINKAQRQYVAVVASVTAWRASAEAKMNQLNSILSNFNKVLPSGVSIRDLLDQFVLPVNGFPTLDGMGLSAALGFSVPNMPPLGNFGPPPLSTVFDAYVQQSVAYAQKIRDEQLAALQKRQDALAASLGLSGLAALPAFNAPVPNTALVQQKIDNATKPFLGRMSTALKKAGQQGNAAAAEFQAAALDASQSALNASDTLLQGLARRTYSFYAYDGFSVRDLERAWDNLINTALGFDYAFRVLHTLMMVRKYWKVSAITLPPGDARHDSVQGSATSVDQSNTLQKVAAIMTHPYFIALVLLAMASVCVSLFISIYLPFYQEYVNNCVFGSYTGNGTMITRNAYVVSYNYAAGDGDKRTTEGINQLNTQRTLDCQNELISSQKQQRANENEEQFISSKYRNMQYQAFSLYMCLDGTSIQSTYPSATWQANSLPPTTKWSDVVPSAPCNVTLKKLRDATFNCSNVFASNNLCLGPDAPSILLSTWTAGCMAEWRIHTLILSSLMVIIMFVAINISRIYILRGIVRVNWRRLSDGRFSYVASCNKHGDMLYPKSVRDGGYTMKRAIREAIAIRLRSWQIRGWGILLFGVFLNAIWLGPLIAIDKTLGMQRVPSIQAGVGE